MNTRRRDQRGLALITVLWILILLSVMAGSFTLTVRREVSAVQNNLDLAQGRALADAAIQFALVSLFHPERKRRWLPNGRWRSVTIDGQRVQVRVGAVNGRVDLNRGAPELLAGLLRQAGIKEASRRQTLIANIEDWRDEDAATRAGGTGEDAYPAGSPGPGNRDFLAVEELQRVIGITPALFRWLAPHVTVYSGAEYITPYLADRDTLLAIPGATPAIVNDYLKRRDAAYRANEPVPPFPLGGAAFEQFGPIAYAIRAWVELPSGLGVGRSVEVARRQSGGDDRPFVILSARELSARSAPSPSAERSDSRN